MFPAMTTLRQWLFPEPEGGITKAAVMARAVFWAGLLWYVWPFFTVKLLVFVEETPQFAHRVDLIFHEAGHWIFGVFGWPLLTAFGGTLMQCLVPLVLLGAFLIRNKDAFSAGVFLGWFGQNLIDCAPYINDARLLQLQLITGGTGREVEGHDWEFLLNELNLIEYDGHIARWVLLTGRVLMALGFLWAAVALWFQGRLAKASDGGGGWSAGDDRKLIERLGR